MNGKEGLSHHISVISELNQSSGRWLALKNGGDAGLRSQVRKWRRRRINKWIESGWRIGRSGTYAQWWVMHFWCACVYKANTTIPLGALSNYTKSNFFIALEIFFTPFSYQLCFQATERPFQSHHHPNQNGTTAGWTAIAPSSGSSRLTRWEVTWVSLFSRRPGALFHRSRLFLIQIVRESDRKPGSYVLSYLGKTGINHFR